MTKKPKSKSGQLRSVVLSMLDAELLDSDAVKQELIDRGLPPTGAGVILLAQLAKAAKGDTEAAKFLRDTSGQKPKDDDPPPDDGRYPLEDVDLSAFSDSQLREMIATRRGLPNGGETAADADT